jgi:cyclopropane fatty-acyl-phospholipid synthase-like methyltransferase
MWGKRAVTEQPQDLVRAGYDEIGERYHSWSSGSEIRLGFVRQVLDRLAAGSTVVDLGCGPGDPATRLLSERHHTIGVDLSAGQLSIARRLAPRASLVQADLAGLALQPSSVDAVVSFYALGHLPSEEHVPLIDRIGSWLRPGGLLLTSAPLTPGDDVDADWLGVPMSFGGIGAEATVAAVEAAGMTVEEARVVGEDEGEGRIVEFLWVTAVKQR